MKLNPNSNADYRFRRCEDEGDGPWMECSRCGYPAPLMEFPWSPPPFGEQRDSEFLCALCAGTHSSSDFDTQRIMRSNHYAANAILFAMGAFGELPADETEGHDE